MKKRWPLVLLMALLLPQIAYSDAVSKGQQAFERGDFEQAVQHWEAALNQFAPLQNQTTQYIDTAVRLSAAYHALGLLTPAQEILQKAQARVQQIDDPVRQANVLSQLADCMIMGGDVHEASDENDHSDQNGICRVKDSSSRWQKAQDYLDEAEALARQTDDTLLLANILNKQGNLWMAREDLKNALKTVREKYYQCIEHTTQAQLASNERVQTYRKRFFNEEEEECLNTVKAQEKYLLCIELGNASRDKILTDNALQCLAIAKAKEKYQQSLDKGKQTGNKALAAKASLNLAEASLNLAAQATLTETAEDDCKKADNRYKVESEIIQKTYDYINALPNSHDKAFALIKVAQLRQTLHTPPTSRQKKTEHIQPNLDILRRGGPSRGFFVEAPVEGSSNNSSQEPAISTLQQAKFRKENYDILTQALQIAQTLQNDRAISYAKGYIAQLYTGAKRYNEAIRLTQQAIFYAQQKRDEPELLYRWEWQLGYLFKKQKQFGPAVEAYKRAVFYLEAIRPGLQHGYRSVSQSFRENEGQLYFELADLLLQQAAKPDAKGQQMLLKDARNYIELFKGVELQYHFQDECVTDLPEKVANLEKTLSPQISPNTAIFYPILLADRIELLLSLGNQGIQQFTVRDENINSTLIEEANIYRTKVEAGNVTQLQHAQKLYKWLLKPIEKLLFDHHVNTLIIVPDGILRSIPFAALHDGKQYLIERYAVAVTPSLKLTDQTRAFQHDNIQILLNGLSIEPEKSVLEKSGLPRFLPLTEVTKELYYIRALLGGDMLTDKNFVIPKMETKLRSTYYNIVHFSTHGNFDSDPNKTFLLTYDDLMTIDQLRHLVSVHPFNDKPVELLTLSACKTAKGNDRAALGLAGVALKAGARSALATLWAVNDAAVAELMKAFYRHLTNTNLSKAQALQKAQQQMLSNPDWSHPYYWAAFLLIGNWL